MERRNLMKTVGGIGIVGALGTGAAAADEHRGEEDGDGDGRGSGGRGGRYTPYGGTDVKTAPELGTFDHVLAYLAEGIVDGPTTSPYADPDSEHYDTGGVEGDPLLAKFWHFDIQKRTVEEIIADRQAHHDFLIDHFGIDMQGAEYGDVRTVPPGTFAPPLGQRGKKARWAFPGEGPDEYTGEEVTDGITEDNMFDTFVWMPDPDVDATDAVVPETSLMLEPKVAYTNYVKSGAAVPANDEDELGGMTNRDTFTANKVRDGGYWIFAVEDDDVPREFIRDSLEDTDHGRPQFWYNTQADGQLRMGRGVAGGKDPDVDPPDKLFLDEVGPDAEFHKGLPEEMGTFWGHYNINRGENRDPISIHYRSGFPTEFNPHSGIPRAFMCELQCEEFVTDRNPQGLGRVHGSTYPTGTTVNGNTNGHNYREHGPPEGAPASTIRNVLTFPPSLTRGRASDPEGERRYNVAPGWPEAMPDSQHDIPGYPDALN
ncbi:hypothetical protein [Halobaculum sp. EA56]|uniref:hypothetical protein n=1 Tax=Halobaculum sp. EA56 TaxID=3421648 RepID=UPI003EBF7BA3